VTDLEPRKKFDYLSSFKFETEFELKFRELKVAKIILNFVCGS
jgi:hypothetical protein